MIDHTIADQTIADHTADSADEAPTMPAGSRGSDGRNLIASELLVEDVSIDGMCGVY